MIDMKIDQYHLTSDKYEVKVNRMSLDSQELTYNRGKEPNLKATA
ncbi:hypothetical protein [Lactiplantibacillus plantarum]